MGKIKSEKTLVEEKVCTDRTITIICSSEMPTNTEGIKNLPSGWTMRSIGSSLQQCDYVRLVEEVNTEFVVWMDGDRITFEALAPILQQYLQQQKKGEVGYVTTGKRKLWLGSIQNSWSADQEIINSPILIGNRNAFQKAYAGADLAGSVIQGIGYSLQKIGGMRFLRLGVAGSCYKNLSEIGSKWSLWANYTFKIPFQALLSGAFFRQLFSSEGRALRDMVFRMLLILFACFTFIFMSYISKDYGISGDEFVDHRHAGYVLDYFSKGDKAALNQPKTVLHLYGNTVQVITAAICKWFHVDNYYELRHVFGGCVGALGILSVGLMGLRWGGGLCGLLSLLLMFFTPRFFGHSMNNLKDVTFAVGYMLSLLYTVRLMDYFPVFRLRHILGLIIGIALALGTRSGGLVLYPMLFMYVGLFYIQYYGIREFYKFKKYADGVGRIFQVLILVIICSYFLAIILWPYALVKPLTGMFISLKQFTNYSIGLRTIFDGEQMMSNMLPWKYAPKYLCIGMPIVTVIGFFAYMIYTVIRKKEFTLISFFFLFATIFPVFWVIYQHSNLYGGIRHLLFVMPPMVVLAARFWSEIIHWMKCYWKLAGTVVFLGLLSLPVIHMVKNHPNDYVYFNEFKGGLKSAYGDYETDYYFNSLKRSTDWFKKNILPGLPKDQKTIIVTQAVDPVAYYFRKDTNVRVIYSRYYEKYAKDWDYAIFGNVYISQFQLKNQLFPPKGALFSPFVDGYPMSYVLKRETKQELEGFNLEKAGKLEEALKVFEAYVADHKDNEEVWSRMGKLYYMTGQPQKAKMALEKALNLHPSLNEALYIQTLVNLELRDYKGAFASVERMLAENSSSADAWYLRASIYYNMKQYQNAINDLNRLLSFRPDFDRAHVLAGDIFRDNGDYQQAFQMYERATKYRNSVNTQVQVADMLVRMKKYRPAEEILKKAVEVQASYYPIYKVMVRMYLQENNVNEAGKLLKQMEQITNDAELYVLRSMYAGQIHDEKNAEAMLQQALAIDPGNVEALRLKKK